jgi:hypothetical protein
VFVSATSLAPAARNWLQFAVEPRVLHVFDRACNLIDSRGEVLSIVSPSIGDGPFSIVVPIDVAFSKLLAVDSAIEISNWRHLHRAVLRWCSRRMYHGAVQVLGIGPISIAVAEADLWSPRPRWNDARMAAVISNDRRERGISFAVDKESFFGKLTTFQGVADDLASAVAHNNLEACRFVSRQLAGLGIGLTPSGDDFLMGAMYALWLTQSSADASILAQVIAAEAAPLTTSLSAAWLRAAAQGEASMHWHRLIEALIDDDRAGLQAAIDRILGTGYSSGREALSGFGATLRALTDHRSIDHASHLAYA